jgi:predicted SAM-dependent methyltransferase
MEIINFKNKQYPAFQAKGNAAQFAITYAKHICRGYGVDIGCMKEEWAFPGAETVDPQLNNYHALDFPYTNLDYIFSSHCLEHISNWVDAMDYWYYKLKVGGTLFLYLPDYSQEYWRPWNNRKHVNIFSPNIIEDYMIDRGYNNIFKSGVDLNNAFMVVGSKV